MIKKHIEIFLTALSFYTRIPCSSLTGHSVEHLNRATIYLPVVGVIIGALAAAVFYASNLIFGVEISIILSMASSILATGGFHEDGFIDACDGFGGGWTREKILAIMKDSRVGAFGAMGAVLALMMKFFATLAVSPCHIPAVIIIAHSLSRFTALSLIHTHEYCRENEDGKAKAAAKKISGMEFCVAGILAIIPLALFSGYTATHYYAAILIILLAIKIYAASYFKKWIGGYTGDCLGAVQQISEVAVYLFMGAKVWK
jgi:adenosylcobinamide-GDP ribazoletransferase